VIEIFKIYDNKSKSEWNHCVTSFHSWDVYYLFDYVNALSLHGDGDILLLYFENNTDRLCYVVMQKDISKDFRFCNHLPAGKYFDWETPYGYGGPLCDSEISRESQVLFTQHLFDYCISHNIVSQFIRFHSLLCNENVLTDTIEVKYLRNTIFIDTSTNHETILANISSRSRRNIRKAINNSVNVIISDMSNIEAFISMYKETMQRNNADEYYMFDESYFHNLSLLEDNCSLFYATIDNEPIAGFIVLNNDCFAHYHLGASYTKYMHLAPTNLLMYEVACWANNKGLSKLHLGGGMAPNDSLFQFKQQFNPTGLANFVVGRTIFIPDAYNSLMNIRKSIDSDFDMNNSFLIQYRR